MPVLYESQCYQDINIVRDVLASYPDFSNIPHYPTVVDANTINIVTQPGDLINGIVYNRVSRDYALPTCTELGVVGSDIGISFTDGQVLTWLIVTVLISAYSIKILKRVK